MRRLPLLRRALVASAAVLGVFAASAALPTTAFAAGPSAPTGLSPSGGAQVSGAPTLSWNAVTGATGYHVQVTSTGTFGTSYTTTVNRRYVPTTQIAAGTITWRARAVDASGIGTWSDEATFEHKTAAAPTPKTPDNGATLQFPDEPPVFSWDPVTGAVGYSVQIDDDENFTSPLATNTTKATSFVMPSPQVEGKDWYWRVNADLGSGVSTEWSTVRSYRIGGLAAPNRLSPLDGLTDPITDVVLRWDAVPGAAKYELEVSTDDEFNTIIDSKTGNNALKSTRYSPAKTYDNDDYWWRVRATDAGGNSGPWAQASVGSSPEFHRSWPVRPTLLAPEVATGSPTKVGKPLYYQWSAVARASYYQVQIGTDANFSPGTFRICETTHTTLTPAWTSQRDANVMQLENCAPNPGTVYRWRVRAVDTNVPEDTTSVSSSNIDASSDPDPVFSLWSDTGSFFYDAGRVSLESPADGATVAVPTLTWQAAVQAEKYRVLVYENDGTKVVDEDTAALSYTPTDRLDPAAGPFRWMVVGVNAAGQESPLPTLGSWPTFTLGGSPTTGTNPDPLTPAGGSTWSRSPALSWKAITGADRYKVYVGVSGTDVFEVLPDTYDYPAGTFAGDKPENTSSLNLLAPGEYDWFVEAYSVGGTLLAQGSTGTYEISALQEPAGKQLGLSGPGALDPEVACDTALDPGSAVCEDLRQTPVLTWDADPMAGFYRLYLSNDREHTNGLPAKYQGRTANTIWSPTTALPENQAGAAYYWYVQPCKTSTSCGPKLPATNAFDKKSDPISLTAPDDGAGFYNQTTFSWTGALAGGLPSGGETATGEATVYHLQVATDNKFTLTSIIDNVEVDQTTYTPWKKTYPDGPLFWRVQAIDGSDNGLAWSPTRTLTKTSPTPVPTSPDNGGLENSTPNLRWDAQSYATKYEVEVYKNNDATYSLANRVLNKTVIQAAYTWDTSLLPASDTRYRWRIRRLDVDLRPGPWSGGRTFSVVPEAPVLTGPSEGAAVSATQGYFTWSKVTGAATYKVEKRSSSGSTSPLESSTVATALAPTLKITDGTWSWRVTAFDAKGQALGTSGWRAFTVDGTAPKLTAKTPTSNAAVDGPFTATFSEKVSGVSTSTMKIYAAGDTNPVSSAVTVDSSGTVATLKPANPLVPGATYTAKLFSGIKDVAGNALVPTEWSVRTSTTIDDASPVVKTYWDRDSSSSAYGSAYVTSAQAGAKATVTFTGTTFKLYGVKDVNSGYATVSVDGGTPVKVSLYSSTTRFKQVVYTRTGLASKVHTVVVTVSGTRPTGAKANNVALDALVVGSTLVDDTSSAWKTAFRRVSSSSARGGSYSQENLASTDSGTRPYWTTRFYGSSLSLTGLKSAYGGQAYVYVDGSRVATIDVYSSSTRYATSLYYKSLATGYHTVAVYPTGKRSSSSKGTYVYLDEIRTS